MAIELPPLPYKEDALTPYISAETVDFHYNKHHKGYLNKLNNILEQNADLATKSLESLIQESQAGNLFNNAAQVWNHTFYWNSLSPQGGGQPTGSLADAIDESFGSFTAFKEEFTKKAITTFGSGWVWLVKSTDKPSLQIVSTSNAETPLSTKTLTPLLNCDVWEHAYYIDYRNARPKYIEAFWNLIHWNFALKNL